MAFARVGDADSVMAASGTPWAPALRQKRGGYRPPRANSRRFGGFRALSPRLVGVLQCNGLTQTRHKPVWAIVVRWGQLTYNLGPTAANRISAIC